VTEQKPRSVYAWIEENRGDASVSLCCAVLEVRREGYYEWRRGKPAREARKARDAQLASALKQVRKEHKDYGTQSMIVELPEELKCSYGKGYKTCREHGLLTKRRKPRSLTKADPQAQAAEDLVQRDFDADMPGTKWFTDITEINCMDGKAYLCGVLDGWERGLLGHSTENHMRTELCTAALLSASRRFGHEQNCIIHSDRGSQFTSHMYREVLGNQGFRQSMGRTGCCYDNAIMESFWATLKKELIYQLPLSRMTRAQVRHEVFVWIETYYSLRRRHTANIRNLPPV
jgi:transposase InsO family protein